MAGKRGNPNWVKGRGGNPGGRPKILGEVKELARKFMYEGGFDRLFDLAQNAGNDSVRLKAVELIMGYGFGRPSQKLEVEGKVDTNANVNIANIPIEQLKQIRTIIKNANPDTDTSGS